MKAALLPLALLIGAAPAIAQSGGFTPESLAEAARAAVAEAAPDAAATRAAAARSERIRAVLAVAQDRSFEELTSSELRALTAAFGPPSEDRDILISWLARGGEVVAANAELTGIYNPHADGWLLLRWHHVGGAPRLATAMLASGALLRGGAEAALDRADMPFAQALVARRLTAHASPNRCWAPRARNWARWRNGAATTPQRLPPCSGPSGGAMTPPFVPCPNGCAARSRPWPWC
jgi:hypothetical protein